MRDIVLSMVSSSPRGKTTRKGRSPERVKFDGTEKFSRCLVKGGKKRKKCKSKEKDRTVKKKKEGKKNNTGIEKVAEEIELIASIRINQRT